jgi:hypothetical protein
MAKEPTKEREAGMTRYAILPLPLKIFALCCLPAA